MSPRRRRPFLLATLALAACGRNPSSVAPADAATDAAADVANARDSDAADAPDAPLDFTGADAADALNDADAADAADTDAATCPTPCTAEQAQCLTTAIILDCEPTSAGCSALVTNPCADGFVCEGAGGAACVDPAWAEWPMPNSVDDDDAGAPEGNTPNPEHYRDNLDGTVVDDVTKLMWQANAPMTTFAWADAVAFCGKLNLVGHHDWRLPTLIELVSIEDYGASNPGMNPNFFNQAPSSVFWSSTPQAGVAAIAWVLDVGLGFSYPLDTSQPTVAARCVR
jgi:hypothetical protein